VVPGAVALRPSNTRADTLVYPDKAAALALPGTGRTGWSVGRVRQASRCPSRSGPAKPGMHR
ncbi:MAG TPA: hypothetical protein VFA63_06870, partial [Pseudonocardiaceae bacterium]|nr:hypothetical protein [Pseudonocardiaceae bacterium]